MSVRVAQVDFSNPRDVQAVVDMVDAYAQHEMGGGEALPEAIRQQMAERYPAHPAALAWLAWIDDEPVGVATCLWVFGTFAARPRINIHDLAVTGGHRDQGIGRKLLEAVEQYAREHNCHALTLEVRGDNARGRHLYTSFGFEGPDEWSPPEQMAFFKKPLE